MANETQRLFRVRNGVQVVGAKRTLGAEEVLIVLADADGNALHAVGAVVPTDATAGYAKGCLFIDTTGGEGDTIYVNEGDADECDFNLAELSGGDITEVVAGDGLEGGGASGSVEVSISAANLALLAIIDAIPETDQTDGETIWNDNGVLKVSSSV